MKYDEGVRRGKGLRRWRRWGREDKKTGKTSKKDKRNERNDGRLRGREDGDGNEGEEGGGVRSKRRLGMGGERWKTGERKTGEMR